MKADRTAHAGPRLGQLGQALPLFTLALTGLLLATGLILEGGIAFVERRDAQNAADLGSLAGTNVIATYHVEGGVDGATVWSTIDGIVRENGCTPGGNVPCAWSGTYIKPGATGGDVPIGTVGVGGPIPVDAQGVEVRVMRRPPTYFLRLIGRSEWDVSAEAAAMTATIESLPPGQVLPIGVDPITPDSDPFRFEDGVNYQLSLGMDAPGNFSWLSWYGPVDANTLATNLCERNNPAMTFPVWIEGAVGTVNSVAVRGCLDHWITNQTPVLLPLWDEVRGQGSNTEFRVVGLATFILQDYTNPAIDSLTGTFQSYYPLPSIAGEYGGPPCDPAAVGCGDESFFLGLIR